MTPSKNKLYDTCMIIQQTVLLGIFLVLPYTPVCAQALAEQFKQAGYTDEHYTNGYDPWNVMLSSSSNKASNIHKPDYSTNHLTYGWSAPEHHNCFPRQQGWQSYCQPTSIESICHSWKAPDFAHEIECSINHCMAYGYSRPQAERRVLEQHVLYAFPHFITALKKLCCYRSYIKELHQKLLDNQGKFYRLRKALGCINSGYAQLLEITGHLYNEIVAQEKHEGPKPGTKQSRTSNAQHWQKLSLSQSDSRYETVQKTFDQQRNALALEVDEWHVLQEIYQEEQLGDTTRIERRIQALQVINNGDVIYTEQTYALSSSATTLLQNSGSHCTQYTTFYGNQLQQIIHQECIEGIEYLAAMRPSASMYPYQQGLAECFDAACQYNQHGLTSKAVTISDFCWTLLDCGSAIVEGTIDGVIGAVKDMAEHPVQMAICAVAGEYVLAYQLGKVLYNVADIGITALRDSNQARQKWDAYIAPVTQLIDALENKQITLRDTLKGATQFAAAGKTQNKLLKGLGNIYTTAKSKAIEFAKNNPPQEYTATPDGMVFKYINKSAKTDYTKSKGTSNFLPENGRKGDVRAQITNKQALEVAQQLGFKKTNFYSHGKPVFQKGNQFITIDADSHNGGFWKMANSIENLSSKKTRLGTYDKNLNRIGD